jgi:hypothetical protein
MTNRAPLRMQAGKNGSGIESGFVKPYKDILSAIGAVASVVTVSVALYAITEAMKPMPGLAAPVAETTVVAAPPKMLLAANAFLEKLKPDQRTRAVYPFDSDERMNWHFVPKARNGVRLDQLEEDQKKAGMDLLRESLSVSGFKKVETIRQLELVLQEMEGDKQGNFRNPGHYYLTVFGSPAEKGVWGWRFEGHHLSLNWTVVDGAMVATSPQFFGANPAEVRIDGAMKGTRVLKAEEEIGRELLRSLTEEQKKIAVADEKAPSDVLTGATRVAAIQADSGIAFKDLKKDQQKVLLSLISEHAKAMPDGIAKNRLGRIRKAGLDAIKFAWMGGTEAGQGHYYRVQGPTFLIEYDNTQNNANHIHAVWREFNGDFGRDALAEHYRNDHK